MGVGVTRVANAEAPVLALDLPHIQPAAVRQLNVAEVELGGQPHSLRSTPLTIAVMRALGHFEL